MVAHLLGLRLRLLAGAFRRSPWQVVGMVLGLLYGVGVAIIAVTALAGLRLLPVDIAAPIVIVIGAVIVTGFLLVPLAFGVDDSMDPRRFALFGIENRRLTLSLAIAALVSVPSLVIIAVAIAQIITWTRSPLATALAIVGAVTIVATCVLGARVTTSIAAFLLSSRRAREATGLVAVVVLVSLSPVIVLLANIDWARDGLAMLRGVAENLSWTPLAAAWSAPASAAAGDAGAALLKLLIALATVAVLWFAWSALVARMLVTPHREAPAKSYHGLGWFGRLPATPAGVIAARSLTYWARDARYRISLVVIPIVPAITIVPLIVGGVPSHVIWLLPVPLMALFLAWTIHNDVAFDHTAIWMHVAANTSGRADRIGRVVPVLLVGVPLLVAGSVLCARGFGDMDALPALLGVTGCILLVGLGLSSIMSVAFPYPAVRPGDNPFQQPQSSGGAAALIQGVSFLAIVVLSLPSILFAVSGVYGEGDGEWWALWIGLGIGVACLVGGVLAGGAIFSRRAPELLAFSGRN